MSSTTELLTELLDNLYDEKDNFSNENKYLIICNLIKNVGLSCNKDNYYNDLLNERDNINFLRASRNKLIKENKKLKKMINIK
jgi:hypothetical protein|tara:strand:- start:6966 stop:7214 length:249 start_codon:yes stop_codon:yes gene_type:complete